MAKTKLSSATLSAVADVLIEEGVIDRRGLDTRNKYAAVDLLKVYLNAYLDTVSAGYKQLLLEVHKRWGEARLPEFMISEGQRQEGVEPHYSAESMKAAYELAIDLKDHRQFSEAASIFVFLIYLDPEVSWFWEGLGSCWQATSQWEPAQFAFGTAVNCDPVNPDLYRSFCNCLLEMGEHSKARAALEYGLHLLRDEPKTKETMAAMDILDAVLAYVKSIETKGRR